MRALTIVTLIVTSAAFAVPKQAGYYVTEHGKTYHRMDCKSIQGHKTHLVTAAEAAKHKLKPCKICKPL